MTCKFCELTKEVYLETCEEGSEVVGREIHFHEIGESNTVKEYIIELGQDRRSVSFKLTPAFNCPTVPALYIHVESYDVFSGNMHLWVIFKYKDILITAKDIRGYQITFVKNITEGKPYSYFRLSS